MNPCAGLEQPGMRSAAQPSHRRAAGAPNLRGGQRPRKAALTSTNGLYSLPIIISMCWRYRPYGQSGGLPTPGREPLPAVYKFLRLLRSTALNRLFIARPGSNKPPSRLVVYLCPHSHWLATDLEIHVPICICHLLLHVAVRWADTHIPTRLFSRALGEY